jgi:hypothetical protein
MICSASNRRSLWETSLDHLVTLAQDTRDFEASAPFLCEHLRYVRWSSDYGYYLQLRRLWLDEPALATSCKSKRDC